MLFLGFFNLRGSPISESNKFNKLGTEFVGKPSADFYVKIYPFYVKVGAFFITTCLALNFLSSWKASVFSIDLSKGYSSANSDHLPVIPNCSWLSKL